jgi:hypothetical protein
MRSGSVGTRDRLIIDEPMNWTAAAAASSADAGEGLERCKPLLPSSPQTPVGQSSEGLSRHGVLSATRDGPTRRTVLLLGNVRSSSSYICVVIPIPPLSQPPVFHIRARLLSPPSLRSAQGSRQQANNTGTRAHTVSSSSPPKFQSMFGGAV